MHLRRDRLRRYLKGDPRDPHAGAAFVETVLEVVDRAVRAKARFSARLAALRMHHELTRLHYQEYTRLAELLMGVDRQGPSEAK